MDKHTTRNERMSALQAGKDHNLDIYRVANLVVQPMLKIIRVGFFGFAPSFSAHLPHTNGTFAISYSTSLRQMRHLRHRTAHLPRSRTRNSKSSVPSNGSLSITGPTPTPSAVPTRSYDIISVSALPLLVA